MKLPLLTFTLLCFLHIASAQKPFAHEEAIHPDSNIFMSWATSCTVQRGYQNIADVTLGYTTVGSENSAIGIASTNNGVVSLGDGGSATLLFNGTIFNGPGADFAVFENGFTIHSYDSFFLEFAFVEVSSDGERFVRFPSLCLNDTLIQKDNGTGSDPRNIHNLAGKYIYGYGTPFDLEDIKDSTGIDINNITHVRIVDVIGSIDDTYATRDAYGNKINDPYPTPFPSGGFDLDAVGVIHLSIANGLNRNISWLQRIYPNPANANNVLNIELKQHETGTISLTDLYGKVVRQEAFETMQPQLALSGLKHGVYFLKIETSANAIIEKIVIQ